MTPSSDSSEKEIQICLGVDVDAVAGWIGTYGGENSPNDIQRGVFAGEVGTPRLLRLFDRYGLKTTLFIPGHSIESFPRQMAAVVESGHEIGAHGYTHERPSAMSVQQERDVMERSVGLIQKLCGRSPRGYVTPWWEMSDQTPALLHEFGFAYDHSQNYNDFVPFYARVGDSWDRIDYAQQAHTWMRPMQHGHEVELVEFCGNWYVDDLPPMMFIKSSPNSHGFVSPRDIEMLWRDQFDWVYRELDYAVLPVTLHPDVAGRPQVLLMLERLIDYWKGKPGVRFMTFEESADYFRNRFPFDDPARASSIGR